MASGRVGPSEAGSQNLSPAATPREMNTLLHLLKTPSGKSSKANQVHAVNVETDNQEKKQNCRVTLFETVPSGKGKENK